MIGVAALGALKLGGKLLAKTKIGSRISGKLAQGAKNLFSGITKKNRKEVKSETVQTDVTAASKGISNSSTKESLPASGGGIVDMLKKYWYVAVGLVLVLVVVFMFSKKKKR